MICAICNAPPPLTLTRNGLRCSKCLLGELELYRGIVSDLGKCDEPLNNDQAICVLCEQWGHSEFCPWRRAVNLKL